MNNSAEAEIASGSVTWLAGSATETTVARGLNPNFSGAPERKTEFLGGLMATYDLVTVGGGVAGSVLAKSMAERGRRVLIVERETQFKDRVRGEFVFPWGVAEAKELGVYDVLLQAGAHHPTYWTDYAGPDPLPPRNFAEDTPQKLLGLCIYHPRMQEALLQAAAAAGAEVRRGARVSQVEPGREPKVLLEEDSGQTTVSARLVVGAC